MPDDKILTWSDFAEERPGTLGSIWHNREPSYPDFLARMWETTHDGDFTPADLPTKPAMLTALEARVDWGRWIVDCDCGGLSSVVEPGQDFLCPVCESWHSVEFPMLKSVIERNLLAIPGFRHRAQNRWWRP